MVPNDSTKSHVPVPHMRISGRPNPSLATNRSQAGKIQSVAGAHATRPPRVEKGAPLSRRWRRPAFLSIPTAAETPSPVPNQHLPSSIDSQHVLISRTDPQQIKLQLVFFACECLNACAISVALTFGRALEFRISIGQV